MQTLAVKLVDSTQTTHRFPNVVHCAPPIRTMIRDARKKASLTQAEVGQLSGIPWETIGKIERGHNVTLQNVQVVGRALDIDVIVSAASADVTETARKPIERSVADFALSSTADTGEKLIHQSMVAAMRARLMVAEAKLRALDEARAPLVEEAEHLDALIKLYASQAR